MYFKQRWSEYKAATRLTGSDVIFQLLECCDESLRKDLTRISGNLTSSSEDTVLKNIKTLAVRQESTMVARFQLQQMMQDRDEPVRAYAARIRGQAGVCQYTTECGSCKQQVDYSDEMVRDTIIHGLEDNDIRLDILSDTNQAMTVEQTITLVEAKESGKRSASRLLGGDSTVPPLQLLPSPHTDGPNSLKETAPHPRTMPLLKLLVATVGKPDTARVGRNG